MEIRTAVQETREDVFFGQLVMIWSRWAIIAVATLLAVWSSTSVGELALRIVFVVVLMAMNFYLHGRYMVERPANRYLVQLAAIVDVVAVTAMIVVWPPAGFASQLFVFYYPVLVGFALVFPPRLAVVFGVATMGLYVLTFGAGFPASGAADKDTVMRLLTLAAATGLGTYYWRVQRARRRAAGRA